MANPCFACLYAPPAPDRPAATSGTLLAIAREFSPRYERRGDDLMVIDVGGLERLLGPPAVIAEELRREAAARSGRVHIALAATCSAASVLAYARPGVTVVEPGQEKQRLAPLPIHVLRHISPERESLRSSGTFSTLGAIEHWGIRTLGELAALPSGQLAARLGAAGLLWQALARGEDRRPLVPDLPEERFEASLDLEWPIEGLEPLSFALTRLLEPLSARLERRDRGAARLLVELRLVTRASPGSAQEIHARQLDLPSPIRDARTLRTLALLDLESHPPPAAIDRVQVVIDPTPGRVLQHTLFTRAQPTPEQWSTLFARLGALMGQDRIGSPATVDTHRPGAFALRRPVLEVGPQRRPVLDTREGDGPSASARGGGAPREQRNVDRAVSDNPAALRRCRRPVPARVAADAVGRPVHVTTDRQGFTGGAVVSSTGPWRTSGDWWAGGHPPYPSFDRDDWDVALADGAVYRIFRDRPAGGWFIDAVVD